MALIEIKGLYKSFGRSEILNDINLDIEEGKVLALIGPTGSGKTTLLRLNRHCWISPRRAAYFSMVKISAVFLQEKSLRFAGKWGWSSRSR